MTKLRNLQKELGMLLNMPDSKINFSDIPELNFDKLGKPIIGKISQSNRKMKEVEMNTSNVIINLTESAIAHVLKEIQKHAAVGVRLGVKKAGCSGFKYIVDYVHTDHSYGKPVYEKEGVNIFIAEADLPILQKVQKLTVDYVREGLNGRLNFINENESGRCGCGESFTTD